MRIFKEKEKMTSYLNSCRKNKTIGFVPTMGAIHSGHLKLIATSLKECDITICSIFVNPTQFNNTNDFKTYPKTLNSDLLKLRKINCDIVYTPEISDLYKKNEPIKKFNFSTLTKNMEGKFRPGHFNGVATIIEKFFHIIAPSKAFFGQKDLQQLQVIKQLTTKIKSKTKIIGVATVREKNGLAKSSRNELLSKKEKRSAAIIYNCLKYCQKNKRKKITDLASYVKLKFAKKEEIKLEYLEFISLNNMQPINEWGEKGNNAICIAAHINKVRLIDNIIL